MGFFKYPYTDLNELNLDWVIAKIKYIEQAKNIIYDNTGTTLISNNVQDAIDEIYNLISTQGVTSFNNRTGAVVPEAGDYTAAQVTFDNTNTGYTAADVQAAIDEADAKIEAVSQSVPTTYVETFNNRSGIVTPNSGDYDATQITYDNTQSQLIATDLQSAVDELAAAPGGVTSFNTRTGAVVPAASDYTAAQIDFDDTVAQTGSSNVQGALAYVATRGASAQYTTYDNTQSGLTATNVQDAIDEVANDVLSSGVASFNGRTGAVNPQAGDYDLTDMGDVTISTPAQDDVLKYDAVSQKWINAAIPTPSVPSDLDDLSDVSISTPTAGQVLKYDGNDWVNAAESGGLPSGAEVYIGSVTFTNTNQAATLQARHQDLADQILAYAQALPNDQCIVVESLTTRGGTLPEVNGRGRIYNNVTVVGLRFELTFSTSSNSRTFIGYGRIHTTLANNEVSQTTLEAPSSVTYADYKGTTLASDVGCRASIYKIMA